MIFEISTDKLLGKIFKIFEGSTLYIHKIVTRRRKNNLKTFSEPSHIVLNVWQRRKVFADTRHTLLSTFKILDVFEEKSTK